MRPEDADECTNTAPQRRSRALHPLRAGRGGRRAALRHGHAVHEADGITPQRTELYAHRPEIAETLFKLNSNIMRDPSSTLDEFLKRKLAAIACKTNGCAYCTAHSCSMLKRARSVGPEGWGLSDDDLLELLSDDYAPEDAF